MTGSPDAFAAHVRAEILRLGPRKAYEALIAANDELIQQPCLENGGTLVAQRSAIHTEIVRLWAEDAHRASGYEKPFAVVALGGTGRGEVAPASDLDYAFLFDDALEGNPLLTSLQAELLHSESFREKHGFSFEPLPFNLEDAPRLAEKQLNAFLDLLPVYDPSGLADRFRERIRATYDSFEHFLHVRGFWLGQWEKAATDFERLDRFDVKHDALRVFLAGIWTLAGKRFQHSREIYGQLDDPRDLEAYRLLMRVRCFVHLRHRSTERSRGIAMGHHPEDVFRFEDFTSFGDMLGPDADEWRRFEFANEVRARLLSARRRVARFTKTIIDRELKAGRPTALGSPIVYGVGGLFHTRAAECRSADEKSRAALSLLLASQRYGVPIDTAELQGAFRQAGDWLVPVPELGALLFEQRGSLANSFAFLSQFEGAENRLFPGYARFETSLDARVMKERKVLRGALERQKIRILEAWVREGKEKLARAVSPERLTDVMSGIDATVEAATLDAEHLAAVKLALKTKRLPLTPEDIATRNNPDLELQERHSSGFSEIPLEEYYENYRVQCGLPDVTVRVARALVAHRRAFKRLSGTPNDDRQVREFAELCGTEQFLRALFVFTCVDRAEWESQTDDPIRWFNSRELYFKTRLHFRPAWRPADAIRRLGCSETAAAILMDFGEAFWSGEYRQHASLFASALETLVDESAPDGCRVALVPGSVAPIIGVAARDFRGLAACITGALWRENMDLRQAHLFSAMHYGLALDFFHLGPRPEPLRGGLLRVIEDAIRERRHISDQDEFSLPPLRGRTETHEWRPGQFRLQHETSEDASGVVYTLCYKVFRHLRGNIFGLAAHATRGVAYVSVYHSLPPDMSLHDAQHIVAERFG